MTAPLPRRRVDARLVAALVLSVAALLLAAPLVAQPALATDAPGDDAPDAAPARSELRIARSTGRVVAPRALDTLALAHSALRHRRLELVPALERMSVASGDAMVARPMLAGAAAELRHARARAGVTQLLDRTAASLDAMCADAREGRRRSCRAMAIDLAAARAHVKAGRNADAKRALASLAKRADEAAKRGELEAWEGTVVAETARYAIQRV